MTTGLAFSDRFLRHETGSSHPERPDRLLAVVGTLKSSGLWEQVEHLTFGPADRASIEWLHTPEYVDRVFEASAELGEGEVGFIDAPDSAICRESAATAQLAVGAALAAVEAVMCGAVRNAFCAVRPPGHHAEHDRSMGFCLFNNIAIAAEYLIAHHHLERIAIIDFDVHHGNGTQHLFERRSDVLFVSIHEDPRYLYPGTGFAEERGIGDGAGFTLNVPMESGGGDEAYARVMDDVVLPRTHEFDPQFVLVSAGFDAAASDPLARMNVSPSGFEAMTQQLTALAESCCDGRLVSLLEGGYDLHALSESVMRHLRVLVNQ